MVKLLGKKDCWWQHHGQYYLWLLLCMLLQVLSGCAPFSLPEIPSPPAARPPAIVEPATVAPPMQIATWADLPCWEQDDLLPALTAFRASCAALKTRPDWQNVCAQAAQVADDGARQFFQHNFTPWQVVNEDGSVDGLITGYYVPDLDGSRDSSSRFPYPLYKKPTDMLVVDLSSIYPELGKYRLRGRLDGQRVVPYLSREQIDGFSQPLHGQELFWVGDPVKLFFLQIQGSGRINLDDGSQVMVNYAEQNGYPYRSIGKLLIERGALTPDQMSMQNIAAWGHKHPYQVQQLLNENPSYVFFRALPEGVIMPPGALGVALTPQRSIAVDPHTIPLGAPVFLSTTWPDSQKPLQRLMVAQDTGGAIKGRVRADFFWGAGDDAGSFAGRMKQSGKMWVLLPNAESAAGADGE